MSIELPEYDEITPEIVRKALDEIGMPPPFGVAVGPLDILVTYMEETLCFSLPSL